MKNTTGLIEKPIILAICGKSCAGKDTLSKWLERYFQSHGIPAYSMISATTRPRRIAEKDNSYYFMSEELFQRNVRQKRFLEITKFRNWHYGLLRDEIKSGRINIGVFDLRGIEHLKQYRHKYTIIPIYIKQDFFVRLQRAHDREYRWRFEHFRRAIADDFHFRKVNKIINQFNGNYVVLDRPDGVWNSTLIIEDRLKRFKVLYVDEEGRIRLGNLI